jgi:hypothetical protein
MFDNSYKAIVASPKGLRRLAFLPTNYPTQHP